MNNTIMENLKKSAIYVRNFFWWSAGVVPSVLEKCPIDQIKYTAIGVVMVAIAMLASVSFAYFLTQTFNVSALSAIIGGVLWGVLIYSVDRVVLTSFRKGESSKFAIFQRFLLTLCLSLFISEPLLMKMFEKEIIKEMKQSGQTVSTNARQNASNRFQSEIKSLEKSSQDINQRIDSMKAERDEKENAVIGEIEGKSGSGKRGDGLAAKQKQRSFNEADAKYKDYKEESSETLSQNKERLKVIRDEIENETASIATADKEADGALAKQTALFNIVSREPGAALIYIPLFLAMIFLELLPLTMKVLGKKGVYDIALETAEAEQITEFEEDKDLILTAKKRLRDLQNSVADKITESIAEDTIGNLIDEDERKVAQKIKSEILRKIAQNTFNHRVSKKIEIKFGHEIPVEVIGHNEMKFKLQLPENVRDEITLKELMGDVSSIAKEIDQEDLKLAKAFSSKGHEIWEDLPLLPQLETDQKLVLQFEPAITV